MFGGFRRSALAMHHSSFYTCRCTFAAALLVQLVISVAHFSSWCQEQASYVRRATATPDPPLRDTQSPDNNGGDDDEVLNF